MQLQEQYADTGYGENTAEAVEQGKRSHQAPGGFLRQSGVVLEGRPFNIYEVHVPRSGLHQPVVNRGRRAILKPRDLYALNRLQHRGDRQRQHIETGQ